VLTVGRCNRLLHRLHEEATIWQGLLKANPSFHAFVDYYSSYPVQHQEAQEKSEDSSSLESEPSATTTTSETLVGNGEQTPAEEENADNANEAERQNDFEELSIQSLFEGLEAGFTEKKKFAFFWTLWQQLHKDLKHVESFQMLPIDRLKHLCTFASAAFLREPNVVEISGEVVVVGSLYGQTDIAQIIAKHGSPPSRQYLFLGDLVDRGDHSVEVLSRVLLLKVLYPRHVFLVRGNHESAQITQVYGFFDECDNKYGVRSAWQFCVQVFHTLPLAAIVNKKVFCVHGGLSPELNSISDIQTLNRFGETPHEGPMCDLVWGEVEDLPGGGWQARPGSGWYFGADIGQKWMKDNGLEMIVVTRFSMEGYKWYHNKTCISLLSAANYCYRTGNVGAVLLLSDHSEPQPYAAKVFSYYYC
jgi:diadenosine tetraphosphatase ApaH/serine/threonine PP2A family protein phosphatase